ncbi:hypothetical protein EEL52_02640 [Muribaculaceae bacterium Isolate-113 (HZI)]|jgi:hypothetical protein|nr:hypothetical protein EEK90_01165 [Muribaculaceae bacterium Isolate-036 (Harlan)]ROT22632.1 hypothetical protein EEL53_04390 [Muribaculaceae bacterium Isolate-114 (HZI)]ROT24803.1 hypothetical protein EEL52_02640 [Muribaculaceae bacterium Isolate-113 (HZI)]
MARRAEDMVRKMAGMPSRKEEERRRKQQQRQQRDNSYSRTGRRGRQYASNEEDSIRSMQEYAEDVEFTETKEYSESEILENESRSERRVYREEQVSDAEYIEIKEK